jgi:hypothetical protein
MSLDFKLLYVYQGFLFVLFAATGMSGRVLTLQQEIVFALVVVLVLAFIFISHRKTADWRRQGICPKNFLQLFAVCGIGVVVVAASCCMFLCA